MPARTTNRSGNRAALLTSSAFILAALSQPAMAGEVPSGEPEAYDVTTTLAPPQRPA